VRSLRSVRRLPQWRKKMKIYSAAKILLDVRNASRSGALLRIHVSWSCAEVGRPKLEIRRKKRQDFRGLTVSIATERTYIQQPVRNLACVVIRHAIFDPL
jgi:hypothetical protein